MKTIEMTTTAPNGDATTTPVKQRKHGKRIPYKEGSAQAKAEAKTAPKTRDVRETIRKRLHALLQEAMRGPRKPRKKAGKEAPGNAVVVAGSAPGTPAETAEKDEKQMKGAEKIDVNRVKIYYELLLKDEAAELERERAEAAKILKTAGPVVVCQEELTIYVRRLLGKEVTI